MAETMVEKVARAMCEASGESWKMGTMRALTGTDHVNNRMVHEDHDLDAYNNHWRHKARAAIEAMREPTDEMRSAALPYYTPDIRYAEDVLKDGYAAMIDAALKEE